MSNHGGGRKPFIFTEDTMAHLRACKAQGMTKVEASSELGVAHTTIDRAAAKAGYFDDVKALFRREGRPKDKAGSESHLPMEGMRKLRLEDVLPLPVSAGSMTIQAATMRWRASA